MSQASVLIVSDDTEFARTAAARWQAEAHASEVTLVTSDLWHASSGTGYDLVIVGPVGQESSLRFSLLSSANPSTAVVCIPEIENELADLRKRYPHVLLIPKRDSWMETLILLSGEALRRVERAESRTARGTSRARSTAPRHSRPLHARNAPRNKQCSHFRDRQCRLAVARTGTAFARAAASKSARFMRWRCA